MKEEEAKRPQRNEGGTMPGLPPHAHLVEEVGQAQQQSFVLAAKLQFLTNAALTLSGLVVAYFLIPKLSLLPFLLLLGWVALWTLVISYLLSLGDLQRGRHITYLRLGLFCNVLSVALLTYLLGEAEGDFYLIYFIPLITAGVYFGMRGALVTAAVSAVSYFALAYFTTPMTWPLLYALGVRGIFFFLVAFLLGLLAESQAQVLAKASLAYERARQLAITDYLTGVYNRRLLDIWLEHEIAGVQRHGSHGSFLMVDLDSFKEYNDKYGHSMGDEALRQIGFIMRSNSRANDVVGRYGGDEFGLLLPQTDALQAHHHAERLRQAIEAAFTKRPGDEPEITISVGIAQYPEDARTVSDLMDRADKALYAAKSAGGKQLCIWGDTLEGATPPA